MKNKTFIILTILIIGIAIGIGTKLILDKDSSMIKDIYINDLKLGMNVTNNMKKAVYDSNYIYEYNNIGINVDQFNKINYLFFSTKTDAKDNIVIGISDINVKYKDKKLETINDFDNTLGKGTEKVDGPIKTIKYIDGNYSLTLTLIKNKLFNIELRKEK